MSRFKQDPEIFDKQTWEDFRDSLTNIDHPHLNPSSKEELDRLVKVTTAIADSIESAQPFADFLGPDLSNTFKNFKTQISNLSNLRGPNLERTIPALNDHATAIIKLLWPFVSKSDAARAAGQAFARCRNLIEKEEKEITATRDKIDKALESIEHIQSSVNKYQQELFEGTDQKASIKSEIETTVSDIDEMFEKTATFYKQLTQGDAESVSIKDDILQAQEDALGYRSEIDGLLSETKNKLKELNRIYSEVVGNGEDSEGLEAQLNDRQNQLNTIVDDYCEKINILYNRVEELLPGATSAGLASAYNDLKTAAQTKTTRYSMLFYYLLFCLFVVAVFSITEPASTWPFEWEAIKFSGPTEFFAKTLIKLPIVVPVVWAALTVSKRRSEMHRLAEEYAHKEALAKSYEGFKQQIIDIDADNKGLLADLLEVLLKAVSLNAARTLDGKHGDQMPLQEVIEKTVKSSIDKIPAKQN